MAGAAFALAALPGLAQAQDKSVAFVSCGDKVSAVHADLIAKWEAANAGFKVATEAVGWDQCQDKVTTLAAAGTPVGLAYVGSRTLKQFAANDLIVPVPMSDDEKKGLLQFRRRNRDLERPAVGRAGRLLHQVDLLEQGPVRRRRA